MPENLHRVWNNNMGYWEWRLNPEPNPIPIQQEPLPQQPYRVDYERFQEEMARLQFRERQNHEQWEQQRLAQQRREVDAQWHQQWNVPPIQFPGPGERAEQIPGGIIAAPPEPIEKLEEIAEIPEEDKAVKVVNSFMIGCDPEIVVLKEDGSHRKMNEVLKMTGPIGFDHSGDVLEIRPRPAKSSFTLLKHIAELVKSLNYGHKHRAGAYFKTPVKEFTLGGHVHIDLPFDVKSLEGRYRILALDEVTQAFEELDVFAKKETAARRERGKVIFAPDYMRDQTPYGAFGDAKKADTANRLEYRTMPSWLYSPVTTFLALTAAKLAASAPKQTISAFASGASIGNVRKFFELFAEKDVDAKRAAEMIFERGLLLQRDPDKDVVKAWREELREIA